MALLLRSGHRSAMVAASDSVRNVPTRRAWLRLSGNAPWGADTQSKPTSAPLLPQSEALCASEVCICARVNGISGPFLGEEGRRDGGSRSPILSLRVHKMPCLPLADPIYLGQTVSEWRPWAPPSIGSLRWSGWAGRGAGLHVTAARGGRLHQLFTLRRIIRPGLSGTNPASKNSNPAQIQRDPSPTSTLWKVIPIHSHDPGSSLTFGLPSLGHSLFK